MRNALSLAKRILHQFSHDPRTVVMFVAAPVLILWLFSIILGTPSYNPNLAAVDLPAPMVSALEEQGASVDTCTADDAADALENGDADAVLSLDGGKLSVLVEGTNSTKTQATIKTLQGAIASMSSTEAFSIDYLHGDASWSLFDFIGPLFIGIFIFVFVFLTSGMSLVTERTGGTMERLLVTPIKSWQIVLGYVLGFGSVALVQSVIVLASCIGFLDFPNEGSLPLVVLFTLSLAVASLSMGLLISALARTAFQVIQFMIIFVVPQIFFSGIFDLSQAPGWMSVLSRCFPITYGASGLRAIMLRGDGFAEIWPDLAVVWGFIAVFFTLASLSFSKRRTG